MGDFIKRILGQKQEETNAEATREQEDVLLKRAIENQRQRKDLFFKTGQESPLSPEKKQGFGGLHYFPIDPAYRVNARLERAATPQQITMPVSQGNERLMLEWGTLNFDLNGNNLSLTAYKPGDVLPDELQEAALFVPFRDATSGKETYGAGRYLDIEDEPNEDSTYTIDFNLAYNPWCAYSEEYSCPLPPPKNWLKVPVNAGEQTFEEH